MTENTETLEVNGIKSIPSSKETIITEEKQYVDTLADLAKTASIINWSLLTEESKDALKAKEEEFNIFLKENIINDENREDLQTSAIEKWNEYKDIVKNASCNITLNNLEVKTLYKKLHDSVEYSSETIFYGIHLKKYFIDTLPAPKNGGDFGTCKVSITFTNTIALYNLLSSVSVKGLGKEVYAFAHLLYKLSEISKIYQHYDAISAKMSHQIREWSLGLSKEQANTLKQEIEKEAK